MVLFEHIKGNFAPIPGVILNFACRVVVPDRGFCARLYAATTNAAEPHHFLRIGMELKEDLRVWGKFLQQFNGVSFWHRSLNLGSDFQVHSDASGGNGLRMYWQGKWRAASGPVSCQEKGVRRDLTFLEFFPISVAVKLLAQSFANRSVMFWCKWLTHKLPSLLE